MFWKKRHAVPRIGQHHTFVGPNSLQRDDLIKPIRGVDLEMSRSGLKPKAWKESLQAHSCPARGTHQITALRVGDARKGDELMHRFESLEFVKRQRKRFFDKSIDS